jgi:hypothetical protein
LAVRFPFCLSHDTHFRTAIPISFDTCTPPPLCSE